MKKTIKLQDLDCASCAAKIEAEVGKLEDVVDVKVNFMTQRMNLEIAGDNFDQVMKQVKKTANKIEADLVFLD